MQMPSDEVLARASQIKLLLMDVDGVLTDGTLWNVPMSDGTIFETKGFDSQDGIALQWLSWFHIPTGVISGRVSPATEVRAKQAHMTYVYQGHIEKIPIYEEILGKAGVQPEEVCFVGDDLTDLVLIRRVGLGIATANAREEVKQFAHYTTEARGGQGAIREVCELLLKAKGLWPQILNKYSAL